MPVQKIIALAEGEQVPDGWWFVKLVGQETRPAPNSDDPTHVERTFIALISTRRDATNTDGSGA